MSDYKKLELKHSTKSKDTYENFLFAEYTNIAKAHFNTINTITSFFRYYLIIIAAPVAFVSIDKFDFKNSINNETIEYAPYLALIFFIISFVGSFVTLYIINLRFEAILYARTVNGIRKYFAYNSDLSLEDSLKINLLPKNKYRPRYFEFFFFFPVILSLSIINSSYFFISLLLLSIQAFLSIIASLFFASLPLCTYFVLSEYRDNPFIKEKKIGIDIDGVLNNHREHFCNSLKTIENINIKPDWIKKIPIHKCPELRDLVNKKSERKVFNDPSYWIDMPILDNCSKVIKKLKKERQFSIEIFSHRPWPINENLNEEEKGDVEKSWDEDKRWGITKILTRWIEKQNKTNDILLIVLLKLPIYILKYLLKKCFNKWIVDNNKKKTIENITKTWLRENNIEYDELWIERGSVHSTYFDNIQMNRFYRVHKKDFFIFIEDNLENAIRLANHCEIIFLINHPYNQTSKKLFEKNIIRVDSWEDINDFIFDNL